MLWFIKFLQKRPSDKTIRISRILFGIVFILALYYNFLFQKTPNTIENVIFGQEISQSIMSYIIYWMMALWIIPIILWFSNFCIARKKYIRIIQIIFSIILFFFSSLIVEWADLDVDTLIFLMALFPMVAWITWKCITSRCIKYWEKIKKIRV